ncbi:MAG: PorV/PorQ family protein [Elusimicrobiaceae bacterium]|nr:PorV/PorQ family protein [Elusimicrobiaceae bacterium]
MKKMALLGLAMMVSAAPALAEGGRTGGSILGRYLGGRSNGMGQAFTAIEGDIESLGYNPGGLAFIERPTAGLSYLRGYAGDNNGLMAVSVRVFGLNITPGVLYYNSGNIAYKNSVTGSIKNVTAEQDTVGMLAVSFRPLQRLGVGGTVKYARFNLAEEAKTSGMYYDVGAVYAAAGGIRLGVAQQNIGPDIKFETQGDPPPSTTRAGAALTYSIGSAGATQDMDIVSSEITFSADWMNVKDEDSYLQCGLEISLLTLSDMRAALRGGYMFNRDVDGLTLGLGADQGDIELDYAFGSSSAMDNRHQITLSYKFGRGRIRQPDAQGGSAADDSDDPGIIIVE